MNKIQIPWEERPVGCTDVMWRYSQNPVIGRYHIPSSNSIMTRVLHGLKTDIGLLGVTAIMDLLSVLPIHLIL